MEVIRPRAIAGKVLRSGGLICLMIAGAACEAGTDDLEAVADGGVNDAAVTCALRDETRFPVDAYFGDGCNFCTCEAASWCEEEVPCPACTTAVCPEGPIRCWTHEDCGGPGGGMCTFPQGCTDEMGYCIGVGLPCAPPFEAANEFTPEFRILCGCDGVSYDAVTGAGTPRRCLAVRWRSLGRCP